MAETPPQRQPSKRRFIIEVRGVLQVEANTGEEANRATEEWIAAVGRGETLPHPLVRVRWLRPHPEREDIMPWPPEEETR